MSFNEWKNYTLGDVCLKITDGAHFSPKDDLNGLPMASVKDLTRYGINLSTCRLIGKEDFDSLKSQGCIPLKGDVLIAKDGNTSLDTVCVYNQEEEIVLLSSIAILRPNSNLISSDFLNYYFDNPITKSFLKDNFRSGSAIPRVVLRDFRSAPIKLPELNIQNRITNILRPIDDKIENNLATNQTLEEIARTLFKEWFVNYNYPGADGRMKSSEMGEIPESWKVGKLRDIAEQVKESINPSSYPDKKFHHYSLPAFDTEELPNVDVGRTILSNKTIVKKWSVLFSKLNPRIPRVWAIGDINEEISISSTEFIGFTPKQYFYCSYLNYFLRQPELVPKLAGIATGTSNSHQRIKPTDLLELGVLIPNDEVSKVFDKIVKPILEIRFNKLLENQELKSTRENLLTKLMSGEIAING